MPESTELTVYEKNLALAKTRTEEIVKEARYYLTPLGIDPQFFSQAAITAIGKDASLVKSDPQSLKLALLKCAQRGLMPDGESAVLVCFNKNVSLIPMYGGMMDIVRRNIPGIAVDVSVVRVWDEFRYCSGTSPALEHIKKPLPDDKTLKDLDNPKTITGAYCIVTLPPQFRGVEPIRELHYMESHEIEKIRMRVKSSRTPGSPWINHPARMYEKTVLRAAFRRLPSRNQIFANFPSDDLDDYEAKTIDVTPPKVAALQPPPKALTI